MVMYLAVFSQSNYNLKFEENEFSFLKTEVGHQILCKNADYYLLGDTTLPALPYKTIHILIPDDADVEDVNINVKRKTIHQDIYLIKNPIDEPVSKISNNSNSNVGNYSKNTYPDKNLNFETVIKSQGFYMAAFSVCPFIYNTQKHSLELITEMDISFNSNRKTTTGSTYSKVKRYDMEDFIRSLVINSDEINMLYPQQKTSTTRATTNDIEYLIITAENLKENFNPLKAWKIRKGVKTEILSTNYIYSNYAGGTNQLKIKNCLRDYYENKNLKWVLLGGDNTVVPVQGCYGNYGSYTDYTMPCDLFYACFDNAFNWDANNNGIIGETNDNIDMAPEIYISRAPIRTAEHINAFINKTLEYETNPTSSNYVKTMLLTGTDMFNEPNNAGESDAHWKSEQMYSTYISPYWTNPVKTKFYDTGTDFQGGANYNLTATNLQTVLNNGYHFVHMATHGNQTIWGMETGNSYSSTNALNQTNSKQSIITTIACITNAFDDASPYTSDPCLSEAFIRNPNGGGVLYWGSSRYGWKLTSFPFSQRFFQIFFSGGGGQDAYKFGYVTAMAKSYFISSSLSHSTTYRWLQFAQNSIGDPELSIYTENPLTFSNATVSQTGATVTVNTGGISGCTIAVTSSSDYGASYFQVAKNVSSYTFTNVNTHCYITITKHNYVPYLGIGNACTTTNFINQTVNANKTVTGCNINVQNITVTNGATLTIEAADDINVQSVTVNNNSKLILDAGGEVNIISGFDIQSGSEFEIKHP